MSQCIQGAPGQFRNTFLGPLGAILAPSGGPPGALREPSEGPQKLPVPLAALFGEPREGSLGAILGAQRFSH